ncbi:MAG: 2Fe-2S iron-sulfur cluster binding domain-containing protein [Deltaproteobacteria bacterium]|nr:2Fe-2S iron-sulfur cluster binding domain-containing protein [Deltaproteobacteria bacterium]
MPKVRWVPEGIEVDVPVGTDLRTASKLAHTQQGDACGGKCACSTCHVYVHEGKELLSEADEDEEDTLDKGFDVRINSRLGCQARVEGEGLVEIEISRESRESYFNEHPDEAPPGWREKR